MRVMCDIFGGQFITMFVSGDIDIAIWFEVRSKKRSINGSLDN